MDQTIHFRARLEPAIELSIYYGMDTYGGYVAALVYNTSDYAVDFVGTAERIGPGSWLAVFYTLSSLFSIRLLVWVLTGSRPTPSTRALLPRSRKA